MEDSYTLREWANAKQTEYDKTDIYMSEVAPLVDALRDKLNELEIPFHFVAAYCAHKDGARVATTSNLGTAETCPVPIMLADAVVDHDLDGVTHHFRAAALRAMLSKVHTVDATMEA